MAEEDRLSAWEALFRHALRAIDSVGEPVFSASSWTFGGGTVLMRRFRHRFSRDVDIFVPDPQYLGYLDPELNDAVAALTPRHLREATYLRLYFPEGEIDFIAAAPVTDHPRTLEKVLDRTVQVDTSIEIVAKKVRYRGAQFTARDIFDFAIVAEMEPDGFARLRPLFRQQRAAILARVDSSDEILRKTFGELDVFDYRRSYDECVGVLRKALEA